MDLTGQVIRVHWHVRKKMWSVSTRTGWASTWRVVRDDEGKQVFFTKVVLREVDFVLSKKGQDRCRKEGRKNVHAWMQGTLVDASTTERTANVPCGVGVSYNPYQLDSFCTVHTEFDMNGQAYNVFIPLTYAHMAVAAVDSGVLVPSWGIIREAS